MWDHVPDAEALLEARWQAGWRPVPTMMKDGAKVLGYAASRDTPASSADEA